MPSSTFEVFPFTGAAFFDTHRFFDPSAKRRSSLTLSTLKGALFDGLCFFGFRKFGVTFAFLWKAWHKSSTSNDLPAFCPLGVSEPRKIIFPGVATFRSERRTGTVFPVGRTRFEANRSCWRDENVLSTRTLFIYHLRFISATELRSISYG